MGKYKNAPEQTFFLWCYLSSSGVGDPLMPLEFLGSGSSGQHNLSQLTTFLVETLYKSEDWIAHRSAAVVVGAQ